jgi:hypothetical protein
MRRFAPGWYEGLERRRSRSGDIPVAVVGCAGGAHALARRGSLPTMRRRVSNGVCASGAFADGDRNVAAPWTPPGRSCPALRRIGSKSRSRR